MKFLSVKEVAKLLKVTTRTVADYKKKGFIPYYQFGRVVRFRESDVLAHIEKNTNRNTLRYE